MTRHLFVVVRRWLNTPVKKDSTMKNRLWAAAAAAAFCIVLASANTSSAIDIAINFDGSRDGGGPTTGSPFGIASWFNTGADIAEDLTGTVSPAAGVTMTWSAANTWGGAGAAATDDESVFGGYLDDGANAAPTVTLTGLESVFGVGAAYTVRVYGFSDTVGNTVGDYTVNGTRIPTFSSVTTGLGGGQTGTNTSNAAYGDSLTIAGFIDGSTATRSTISGLLITDTVFNDPVMKVVVNRDSGNISLVNNTTSTVEIAGMGILSADGSLDATNWTSISGNYDDGNGGANNVSPSGEVWELFASSSTELSEGTLGTGTLTPGQSVDLGDGAWRKHFNESDDLTFEFLLADSNETVSGLVEFTGVTQTSPFEQGDYDFDGDIDADDWAIQRDNYQGDFSASSAYEAYTSGDFDADGDNDVTDLKSFKAAFLAQPGASLADLTGSNVPEPSMVFLLATAAALVGCRRYSRTAIKSATMPVALLAVCLLASQATNADSIGISFAGDNAGGTTIQITPAQTAGVPTVAQTNWNAANGADDGGAALALVDDSGAATTASVTWSSANTWGGSAAPTDDAAMVNGWLDDGGDGALATITGIPYSSYDVYVYGSSDTGNAGRGWNADINGTNFASAPGVWEDPVSDASYFDNTNYIDGSTGVNNPTYFLAAGQVGDLTVAGLRQTIDGIDSRGGISGIQIVESTGLPPVLTLQIDTVTGAGTIRNLTGSPVDIDFYEITSDPSDSLSLAGWNSIEDNGQNGLPQGDGSGNGWEELGDLGGLGDDRLGEFYLQGSSVLAADDSIALGNIFNTATGVQDDVSFSYNNVATSTLQGIVEFVTGVGVDGDYNNNGIVDAADYAVWREALGVATSLPNEGGISPGVVDTADYNFWKSRFGATSGAGNLASPAVPEPSAMVLMFAMFGGLALLTTSRRNGVRTMLSNDCSATVAAQSTSTSVGGVLRMAAPVVALAVLFLSASAASAAFDERAYLLGDDGSEGAVSNGVTVGGAGGNVVPGSTLDTSGPTGGRLDITVEGSPTYTAGALSTSTFGASFNGTSDRLVTGFSVNSPNAMWNNATFFPTNNYRLNYDGIFNRGIQVWAKPNAGTTGVVQTLVQDSLQHGIIITAADTWAMTFDGDPNASNLTLDSGLSVASTGQTTGANAGEVSANGYTHLMALSGAYVGIPGEPDIFDAQGVGSALGALFYVNGVAVSGNDDFFYDDDITELSVGSSQSAAGDFYHGDLDDLRIFVWGDNSDTTAVNSNPLAVGTDYGTLDLGETNEWIKAELSELGVTQKGDVDLDGDVDDDDVTAFIDDWRKVRLVAEAQGDMVVAGDWISRRDNSDLNYDGVTNFSDWFLLRADHPNSANLNLAELLAGRSVPEPTTLCLAAFGLVGLGLGARRR